jgi:cobalt-zinc-cadmium efflux system outer membrane protein
MADLDQAAADLAQRQHDAGTLNELGMTSQRAIYHQAKVDVAQAEAQLIADRERLNRLMGLWGDQTTWTAADQLPDIPPNEIPIDHLESLAMRQRLDLAASRDRLTAAGRTLGLTQDFRYFSNLDIGIDTEREPDGQHLTGPTLSLQLPIFDQGQAAVARAEAQYRQLERRFEGQAIDIRSQVREARDRMVARRNLAEYYKILLPERVRILNLTLLQYNGMFKSAYDLILARQGEMMTEQAYIEAWRDYWLARTELERAVGGRLPTIAASSPTTRAQQQPTAPAESPATAPASDHSTHHTQGAHP